MELYRAEWLLPITSAPIKDGALVVDGGSIVHVGPAAAVRRFVPGVAERDLGDSVVLPGLINAHCHLELTCYRGCLAPAPLWDWFEQLIALRLRPSALDAERQAVAAGAEESLAAGVTCVADISRTGLHIQALRASPIRKVCFLELISGAYSPPNDARSLAEMLAASLVVADPPRLTIGVSPHALYTVTWDDLVATSGLLDDHQVPVTIHLLETAEEASWLPTGGGPLQEHLARWRLPTAHNTVRGRAFDLLDRAGILRHRPLLAHVNHLDDHGLRDLAKSGAGVAWCPRSHQFFGHPPHRWQEMVAAGINVCVGTDSLASNETLSVFDELRYVRRTCPSVPPNLILELGTIRGAVGLGLDRQLGSLEPGKCADFVAIPWDPTGPDEPAAYLLDVGQAPVGVWIDGVAVR